MKFYKYWITSALILGTQHLTYLHGQVGQETRFDRQLRERDDQPVKDFLESKENIDLKKKANNLEISGDVRCEWRYISEKGQKLYVRNHHVPNAAGGYDNVEYLYNHYQGFRGGSYVDNTTYPISNNDFDIEFNLKLKYTFERAWAMAHIRFDEGAGARGFNECAGTVPLFNPSGSSIEDRKARNTRNTCKGSGFENFVALRRAFVGYNLLADGKRRLDIELGRRKFDDIFVSEVEFSSRFDGILLKYSSAIDEVADWYCYAGSFLVDERVNHFGFAAEIGLLNIMDWGLDLRYSFVDWRNSRDNRCFLHDPTAMRFQNSQISFSYTIYPSLFCIEELPIEFYGGFLVNHAAPKTHWKLYKFEGDHKRRVCDFKARKNLAWYFGIYLNDVHKKGDWALDLEYIVVQAAAVSDYDVGSIGRGNILDANLHDRLIDGLSDTSTSDSYISSSDGTELFLGNANFKGIHAEFLYALTDNLTLDFIAERSWAEDKRIGGRHSYYDFEVEVIYAF